VDAGHVREAFQVEEYLVLEDEDLFVFVFLLNFQGNVLLEGFIVSLINETWRERVLNTEV